MRSKSHARKVVRENVKHDYTFVVVVVATVYIAHFTIASILP